MVHIKKCYYYFSFSLQLINPHSLHFSKHSTYYKYTWKFFGRNCSDLLFIHNPLYHPISSLSLLPLYDGASLTSLLLVCWHCSSSLGIDITRGQFHKVLSTSFGACNTHFGAPNTKNSVPYTKIQFSISWMNFGVLNTKVGA